SKRRYQAESVPTSIFELFIKRRIGAHYFSVKRANFPNKHHLHQSIECKISYHSDAKQRLNGKRLHLKKNILGLA
ncbi:hypothetical protein, partial [Salmonella enterica]|uniref:hypothetical protein n=1 Tax=Salmonella enterica TaxID=28901 RepID=UPI003CF1716A